MSNQITLAFAGSGETTTANIEDLLNDWLGFGPEEDDGYYGASIKEIELFLPASNAHSNKELDKIVTWSAKADLPFTAITDGSKSGRKTKATLDDAVSVDETDDINKQLVALLASAKESYLVLLYGEEGPNDEVMTLLELAIDAGVEVKDLTAGLDDVVFGDEAASEPEPSPEEKPKRRGRKVAEQEEVQEELTETPQETYTKAKEETSAAKKKAIDKVNARNAAEEEKPEEDTEVIPVPRESLVAVADILGWAYGYVKAEDIKNAAKNLAEDLQESPLTKALAEALIYVKETAEWSPEATGSPESDEQAEEVPEAPKKSRGRPRADGSPAQPKDDDEPTIGLFEDEEGNLTKAGRGRPPKGQKRVKVSQNEFDRMVADGEIEVDDE